MNKDQESYVNSLVAGKEFKDKPPKKQRWYAYDLNSDNPNHKENTYSSWNKLFEKLGFPKKRRLELKEEYRTNVNNKTRENSSYVSEVVEDIIDGIPFRYVLIRKS